MDLMNEMITQFPQQLKDALQLAGSIGKINEQEFRNILIVGMGGSGIGGDFTASFVRDYCKIPIQICKTYDIPNYVDQHTFAIVSTYSGNTEETIHCLHQLIQSGAKIVVLTSGGKAQELATTNALECVLIPSGWASPRACLGFSIVLQLGILFKAGIINEESLVEVEKIADYLEKNQVHIHERAKHIASFLKNKTPIIYTSDKLEPVGLRLRQQMNENAKLLCWHNVFPEMNHNELVGWANEYPKIAILYLRSKKDFYKTALRMEISKDIINNCSNGFIELYPKGDSWIEQSLYYVHLGDWISYELALIRGVDAIEIDSITYLKNELAKYEL